MVILPRMSTGDWFFWSILSWIFFHFFWLKFVEKFLPLWIGTVFATIFAFLLFWYGPRPVEEEEEEGGE